MGGVSAWGRDGASAGAAVTGLYAFLPARSGNISAATLSHLNLSSAKFLPATPISRDIFGLSADYGYAGPSRRGYHTHQ